mmetsp:Transcript_18538/g.39797  ORF Transcript_18538/g.39797 Transcript_18538/m.39797 type:complete len:211 (+) Transcript_18538:471-1103(+)
MYAFCAYCRAVSLPASDPARWLRVALGHGAGGVKQHVHCIAHLLHHIPCKHRPPLDCKRTSRSRPGDGAAAKRRQDHGVVLREHHLPALGSVLQEGERPRHKHRQAAGQDVALGAAAPRTCLCAAHHSGLAVTDDVHRPLGHHRGPRQLQHHVVDLLDAVVVGAVQTNAHGGRQTAELIEVGGKHALCVALHQLRLSCDQEKRVAVQHQG